MRKNNVAKVISMLIAPFHAAVQQERFTYYILRRFRVATWKSLCILLFYRRAPVILSQLFEEVFLSPNAKSFSVRVLHRAWWTVLSVAIGEMD